MESGPDAGAQGGRGRGLKVKAVIFGGGLAPFVRGQLEAEGFVVVADGEPEYGAVAGETDSGQLLPVKENIQRGDTGGDIVEEGAIPVPDQMADGRTAHDRV